MPDMPMPGQAPGMAGPAPAPGSSPQQGQSTGPGTATQPSPNLGTERAALTGIGMLSQMIAKLIPNLPFGSDAYRDISEALNKIAKHAAMSSVGVGEEQSQLQKMAIEARQRQGQMQQMMSQGAPSGAAMQRPQAAPAGVMQQQQAA